MGQRPVGMGVVKEGRRDLEATSEVFDGAKRHVRVCQNTTPLFVSIHYAPYGAGRSMLRPYRTPKPRPRALRALGIFCKCIKNDLCSKKMIFFCKIILEDGKMKKTGTTIGWFTAFLCVALLWGSPAMAESYGLYIGDTRVTDANCNDLRGIPGVTVVAGSVFKYTPASKTLTMKGVTGSVGNGKHAIWNESIKGLTIVVSGTNSLKATTWTALLCRASTAIEGNGSLTTVSESGQGVFVHKAPLTISNIMFETTGKWGLTGNKNGKEILILKNATVNAKGTEAAIANLKTVTLERCGIIAPEGGKFNEEKQAVVDTKGNRAKEVKIAPIEIYELYIAGTQVTDANCNNLKDITGVTVAPGGEFKYYAASKTLTMKGVTVLANNYYYAIWNKGIEGLKIVVSGTNRLEAKTTPLRCEAAVEIEGNGSLTIASDGVAVFVNGTTLTISDITLEATGKWGIIGDKGMLILKNATVNAKGTAAAIAELKTLTLKECRIVAPEGGKFDDEKHAVVDSQGNRAKEVKIAPIKKYELYIAGTQVTDANCNNLKDITGVTVSEGGEFKYDPVAKKLTMKGVTVSVGNEENAIWNEIEGLEIVISGSNRLEATNWSALNCFKASTKIEGSGFLTTTSKESSGVNINNTTLTISNITFEATGKRGIAGFDEDKNETLIIKKAKVNAKGEEAAIADLKTVTLEGCRIIVPEGAEWKAEKKAVVDKEGNKAKEVKIEKDVAVTGVKVTPTIVDLKVNETKQLTITVEPNEATNKNYTCESNNKSVAIVDSKGLVIAVGAGTAIITITTEDGKKTALCRVNVTESGSFALSATTLNVTAAGTTLGVNVTSDKAWTLDYDSSVTWLKASPKGGVGSQAVTFTVEKNESTVERTVVVTFKQAETKKLKLTITQEEAKSVHVPLLGISSIESALKLKVGTSATLFVKYNPDNATNKKVTWEVTEGAASLSVDANSGKITATNVTGTAKVKATSEEGGHTAECTVTVTTEYVPVESISVSPAIANLTVGGTQLLSVSVKPQTATNKTATWAVTAGADVVSVDGTGLVRALKEGTATVTATVSGKTATCTVNVTEGGSTPTFALNPTMLNVPAAGGVPSVNVTSDKAWTLDYDSSVTWLKASTKGGAGSQEVTFTVEKNESTAERTVVVTFKQAETAKELKLTITQEAAKSVLVPLLGISFTESALKLKVKTSATLFVKYNPENATNKKVTWEVTEGAASLSVDANSGKITATNVAGTAKVKATSEDGGHTAECTITVTNEDVPVESISIWPAVVNLTVEGTQRLLVSVKPRTATNKTATWAVTAGADIVSVDGTGLVRALKEGTATVTATVGGKTATCTVNVTKPIVPQAVEDAVLASVVVAPNPFAAHLRIVNPEGIALRYELVTLTGNVVRAGALDGTETVVDTETLPAGLYFVRLTGQNRVKKTVKVVKY